MAQGKCPGCETAHAVVAAVKAEREALEQAAQEIRLPRGEQRALDRVWELRREDLRAALAAYDAVQKILKEV